MNTIKSLLNFFSIAFLLLTVQANRTIAQSKIRVVGFYSKNVERDHVDFANDALQFFDSLSRKKNFLFDTTTNWGNTTDSFLSRYQLVVWINEFPQNEEQRRAFERYMNHGGGWLGFHVSGYNDRDSHWPWFVDFMGGAVFYSNNWPPLPAVLDVDDGSHPVTQHVPSKFKAPINEWYSWKPNPRLNKNVKVLVTLDTSNYPLGKKDILKSGDVPVVWTNTQYKMLYMNMGHGDKIFTDVTQNTLIADAIMWMIRRKK